MTWYLKTTAGPGAPDIAPFRYGAPGSIPVVGDWDGNGTATAGVVNPAGETWYLRNSNTTGAPDVTPFAYGAPGWTPVVGDWDGNGTTSVGVVDPTSGTWFLRNENGPGAPDAAPPFAFGGGNWYYLADNVSVSKVGSDGTTVAGGNQDEIVAFDPTRAVWNIRFSTSSGTPDMPAFACGTAGRADFAAFDNNEQGGGLTATDIAAFQGDGNRDPNNPLNVNQTPPVEGGNGDANNPINANQTPITQGGNGAWNNPGNANQTFQGGSSSS
jgi:hypothetical protein